MIFSRGFGHRVDRCSPVRLTLPVVRRFAENTNEFLEAIGMGKFVVERIKTEIAGLGIERRANMGALNNTFSVFREYLECHKMSTVVGKADELTTFFLTIAGPVAIVRGVVNWLPEAKAKEHAGINRLSSSKLEGNATDLLIPSVVEQKANLEEGQEPVGIGHAGAGHDNVRNALDGLDTAFGGVLMLLVWLTVPTRNGIVP